MLKMAIPTQWYQTFFICLFVFGGHESREEESSRIVKIRSRRSSRMAIIRTEVDSRNLANWVLHGALFRSWSSCVELQKMSCHICLLYQLFMRLCTEDSRDSKVNELVAGCDGWIWDNPLKDIGFFIDDRSWGLDIIFVYVWLYRRLMLCYVSLLA